MMDNGEQGNMPKSRLTSEEIIDKLRMGEIIPGQV
jgi:hypothetical protein